MSNLIAKIRSWLGIGKDDGKKKTQPGMRLRMSQGVLTGPAARTPAESPQSPDAPEARETQELRRTGFDLQGQHPFAERATLRAEMPWGAPARRNFQADGCQAFARSPCLLVHQRLSQLLEAGGWVVEDVEDPGSAGQFETTTILVASSSCRGS